MTDAVRKKLKSAKLWAIFVAVAVGVWGLAFYWIAQPTRSEKLEIWLGASFSLKREVIAEVEMTARAHGIKECAINSYDPRDTYYAQAFGLRANSVDIYILEKPRPKRFSKRAFSRRWNTSATARSFCGWTIRTPCTASSLSAIIISSSTRRAKRIRRSCTTLFPCWRTRGRAYEKGRYLQTDFRQRQ